MGKGLTSRRSRGALYGGVSLLTLSSGAFAATTLPDIDIGGEQAAAAVPSSEQAERNPANAASNFGYGGGPLIDATLSPAPNPVSSVTPEGIRILGGPAQASSYKGSSQNLPEILR